MPNTAPKPVINPDKYDFRSEPHELAGRLLWRAIEEDKPLLKQAERILRKYSGDIEPTYLGFMGTYHLLEQITPRDRVVYDVGCSYGFQAWFFRHHKKYVGIDLCVPARDRLQLDNTEHHKADISDWVKHHEIAREHFAICNYVPQWGTEAAGRVVARHFEHQYVFYPTMLTRLA